jgi:alpha-amylase
MKKHIFAALLAAGAMACASHAGAATPKQQAGGSSAIMLQGFHWNSANYAGPDWYTP